MHAEKIPLLGSRCSRFTKAGEKLCESLSASAWRAERHGVCMCLHISRAEYVSLFVCQHQDWKDVPACAYTYQEPSVYLRVFERSESQTCFKMCLNTF